MVIILPFVLIMSPPIAEECIRSCTWLTRSFWSNRTKKVPWKVDQCSCRRYSGTVWKEWNERFTTLLGILWSRSGDFCENDFNRNICYSGLNYNSKKRNYFPISIQKFSVRYQWKGTTFLPIRSHLNKVCIIVIKTNTNSLYLFLGLLSLKSMFQSCIFFLQIIPLWSIIANCWYRKRINQPNSKGTLFLKKRTEAGPSDATRKS